MEIKIPETVADEDVYLRLIETSLEGVMFHNYNIDVFDVLDLPGFKKLHMYQYKEEGHNLECLKHTYIEKFRKLPVLTVKSDFWRTSLDGASEETLPAMVKQVLTSYYDWESGVLDKLLEWRKCVKDKSILQERIRNVMCEIEQLETLMDILDEHEYDYECICQMSNYLYYK